jgi:hypothetical protein
MSDSFLLDASYEFLGQDQAPVAAQPHNARREGEEGGFQQKQEAMMRARLTTGAAETG